MGTSKRVAAPEMAHQKLILSYRRPNTATTCLLSGRFRKMAELLFDGSSVRLPTTSGPLFLSSRNRLRIYMKLNGTKRRRKKYRKKREKASGRIKRKEQMSIDKMGVSPTEAVSVGLVVWLVCSSFSPFNIYFLVFFLIALWLLFTL